MIIPNRARLRVGARWSARERRAVALAAWVLFLALLWSQCIAPAWRVLSSAPAQRQALDAQLAYMHGLAAQAEATRQASAGPVPDRAAALAVIQRATQALGPGALTVAGAEVSLRVAAAPPEQLARHLEQLRREARVTVVRTALQRRADGWHGQLTLAGPGLGEDP
jgi:general secretion pathway protein M